MPSPHPTFYEVKNMAKSAPVSKPVKTYRHAANDGSRSVEAAIWKNSRKDGGEFFSVTFQLQYKDGSEYKTTTSFGVADLYQLIRCSTDAAAWIFFETLRGSKEEREAA